MKILIIAYHFYPDVTPRAFRAFELVKQFSKEGHTVRVLLPGSDYDYSEVCKKYNFTVDFVDYHKPSEIVSSVSNTSQTILEKLLKKLLKKIMQCVFPSGRKLKFYFYYVYKKLMDYEKHLDMIISIAAPYDNHIGAAMAFRKNKYLEDVVKVADYGDPFYKNPALPNCPFYFWIDKFIASKFDFITIPTEKAFSIYTNFKEKRFIKIIPQGFDFSKTKIADYQINDVPVFAYAGIFYEDIRNPKPLLEFLLKLHANSVDFIFIIYTTTGNFNSMKLLNKYKNILKEKLIINQFIPREDVIFELSKMDFLINLENLSSSQVPSKLIDYTLTKRPIYSFSQVNFFEDTFMNFFRGNYSEEKKIDLDDFNIENVSKQFTELIS